MDQTQTPTPAQPTEHKSHKEELRQNDLAEFLTHMGPWFKRHQKDVMFALIVVIAFVGFIGGRSFMANRDYRKLEDAWSANQAAVDPYAQAMVAQQHAQMPMLHNLALLEAADTILYEVIGGTPNQPGLPGDLATIPDDARRRLDQAIDYYQKVIDAPQPADPPYARLSARLGLAGAFETLGQWDKAKEQYELIKTDGESLPNYVQLAQRLIDTLADRQESIVFAAARAIDDPSAGQLKIPGQGVFDSFQQLGPTDGEGADPQPDSTTPAPSDAPAPSAEDAPAPTEAPAP